MSNKLLYWAVGFGVLIVSLLFCFAYDLSNANIYYTLTMLLGYNISMKTINYFKPTAFDAPPPPEPKTRQEKKRAAKDAEAQAKRYEKTLKIEADAARKIAEARERD